MLIFAYMVGGWVKKNAYVSKIQKIRTFISRLPNHLEKSKLIPSYEVSCKNLQMNYTFEDPQPKIEGSMAVTFR